ncbi:hypothetical protein B0H11DRAFT_2288802 [Mycena galericulata]|nr:hypothetical protein B0H11DRAFT_2288802 [Mycena galericulata]
MTSNENLDLSWQTGAPINIPGCVSPRPAWFRHQTPLESTANGDSRIVTSIRLSPNPSLNFDVVKAAVRQLRFDHPAIASEHGWSGSPPAAEHAVFAYQVPSSESDIDSWLSQVVTDATHILEASNGDIGKAIDTLTYNLVKPDAPDGFFFVHYIPAASPDGQHGLVFSFSHAVFDAVGCFQLMDMCASRIADSLATGGRRISLPWGEETSRLPPALADCARIPRTAEKLYEDEFMIQNVRDVVQSYPTTHTLPAPRTQSSPSPAGVFTRIVPTDVLETLRTTAREHGCTIFSFMLAATSLSSVRVRSPEDTTNLTLPYLYSPVDTRSLACEDPYDRSQWAVRLSMGFNSYVTRDLGRFVRNGDSSRQLPEDVWVLAKEVRKKTEEQKKHMERMPVWLDDVLAAMGAGGAQAVVAPSRWYPIVSSIGVVDNYLARSHPIATGGQLTVSSPRLRPSFPTPFLGCSLALHAFTWGGELMMEFSFPEGTMGSAEDQVTALKEGRNEDAIGLQFVNEFMHILEITAQSK